MKIDIMFGMVLSLLRNGRMRAKEFSTKYDISIRTVYRYIDALNLAGVPVVCFAGKNGGIEILHTFKLNESYFTLQEKMTLIECSSFIQNKKLQTQIQTKLLSL